MNTLKEILNETSLKESLKNVTISNTFKLNESTDSSIIMHASVRDDITDKPVPFVIFFKESSDRAHTTISVKSDIDNSTNTVPNSMIKEYISSVVREHLENTWRTIK